MQQSNLTAFQMIRMHRGAHYGAAPVKEPRMDTLLFLFICPSARALLHVHTAHLLPNTCQSCWEKVRICGSPLAWSWRAGGTVTSALFPIRTNEWREAAAPSIHRWRFAAERRPSYRSFSVAWDKESIVLPLVLPRFKTPARRGAIHRHTPVKKKKNDADEAATVAECLDGNAL